MPGEQGPPGEAPAEYKFWIGDTGPTGPLFSGVQQYPFICWTSESKLGQPLVDNWDAKGNAVYVHWIPSPAADADYRPSVVLDRLAASLPEPLLVKYRDAIVGAPARLSLDALGALGVVPPPRR